MIASFRRSRSPASRLLLPTFLAGQRTCLAQSDDAGDVQRAGAHTALVSAAIDLRHQLHPGILPPYVERAHALGAIKLVRRNRREIDIVLDDVERDLADGLHRVGVEEHAALVAQRANLAMGCSTPISLFAAMMVTRMVLSSMARFRSSRSMRPSFCTGR
jgi:hypothetical protein